VTRLRLVSYSKLAKVVESKGFHHIRTSRSHNVFRHTSGKIIVIPDHGAQEIVRPLLRKILRDLDMSLEEYNEFLKEN